MIPILADDITDNDIMIDDDIMTDDDISMFDDEENTFPPPLWRHDWIDFEQNKRLKAHKQSLPISIQRIIEWANMIIGYNKVIDLNFEEIEKDLKYQYKKYNGDKTKLKQLYFNYDANKDDSDYYYDSVRDLVDHDPGNFIGTNFMYFGERTYTMIHFIFNVIRDQNMFRRLWRNNRSVIITANTSQRIQRSQQALILLKLLIQNKIIDIDDEFDDTSIWDTIKQIAATLRRRHKDVVNNIDELVDLIVICLNQKQEQGEEEAILEIQLRETSCFEDGKVRKIIYCQRNISDDGLDASSYSWGCLEGLICDDAQLIHKLLYRGMLPFRTVNKKIMNELLNKYKIAENTSKYKYQKPYDQMILLSPLVLLSHLNRARYAMNDTLSKNCDYFSRDIANVISSYLFIDYELFYDKQLQHSLNVKAIGLLNHLKHLSVDQVFMNDFNEKYNNKQVINYAVENYLYALSSLLANSEMNDIDIICPLIKAYNNNNDKNIKFPLKPLYGVYFILTTMLKNKEFSGNYKIFLNVLKYVKKTYKDEFDINFNVKDDSSRKMVKITDYLIKNQVWFGGINVSVIIIKFIFTEFKDEYDMNNPCLLYECLKHQNLYVFQYLVTHHDYSLDKICSTMINMINYIKKTSKWAPSHKWTFESQCKRFLQYIEEFCLKSICENQTDIQLLNKTIKDTWETFESL